MTQHVVVVGNFGSSLSSSSAVCPHHIPTVGGVSLETTAKFINVSGVDTTAKLLKIQSNKREERQRHTTLDASMKNQDLENRGLTKSWSWVIGRRSPSTLGKTTSTQAETLSLTSKKLLNKLARRKLLVYPLVWCQRQKTTTETCVRPTGKVSPYPKCKS